MRIYRVYSHGTQYDTRDTDHGYYFDRKSAEIERDKHERGMIETIETKDNPPWRPVKLSEGCDRYACPACGKVEWMCKCGL